MSVDGRGIIYVGHLPAGFEENELKSYFKQFGAVTRLKLSRSTRTGGSKGYAFVEFASEDVAAIAAESMNGYLMFNKVLQCKVVQPDKIHPSLFRGCNRTFRPSNAWKRAVAERNKDRDSSSGQAAAKRARQRVNQHLKQLKALGLNPPNPVANEIVNLNDSDKKPVKEDKNAKEEPQKTMKDSKKTDKKKKEITKSSKKSNRPKLF